MTLNNDFFAGSIFWTHSASFLALDHAIWTEPLRFGVYLLFILLAAAVKLVIPHANRNCRRSVDFMFVLLACIQLSLAEALIAGCFSVLMQHLFNVSDERRPGQVAGRMINYSCAVVSAFMAYQFAVGYRAPWLAVAAACAVYFIVKTSPVGFFAMTKGASLKDVWLRPTLQMIPFYACGAATVAATHLLSLRYGWPLSLLVLPAAGVMYLTYRNNFGRIQDQRRHMEEMASLHLRTIETLALAIEAKDHNTHEHLCRVRLYACELGKELGLDPPQMEALRAAALLHDIGKLAIPEHIINKPGKLTPEEFERMKIHPLVGAEILDRVNFPYPVAPIVRSHHERWDGRGYPDGLAGEQIPIGARILTVVDCLDALATDRPYRRALTFAEAVAHISRLSGAQFDPRVVELLKRRYVEFEALAAHTPSRIAPLNLNIQVPRGDRPGAGFEQHCEPGADCRSPRSLAEPSLPAGIDPEFLEELAQPLGSSLSLDETLKKFSARLIQAIPFDTIAVYMRRKERLLPKFVQGEDEALFSSLEIPIGEGLSGWVAQNRRPIINGNPSVEPGYLNDPTKYSTLRSALAVPLENANREILGVFVLYARAADAFHSRDLAILQGLAPAIARAIESAIRYHLAESQATTDFLTRALNARTFFTTLDQILGRCMAERQVGSLILCDLDAFREVNHTFGHIEGNKFLSQLADRFREIIRDGDTLARLGGDEFALVLPGLDAITAEARMRDLRAAVRQTSLEVFGDVHVITASLGLASLPGDGTTGPDLLKAADTRLQNVKRSRKTSPERTFGAPIIVARG